MVGKHCATFFYHWLFWGLEFFRFRWISANKKSTLVNCVKIKELHLPALEILFPPTEFMSRTYYTYFFIFCHPSFSNFFNFWHPLETRRLGWAAASLFTPVDIRVPTYQSRPSVWWIFDADFWIEYVHTFVNKKLICRPHNIRSSL